MKKSNYLRILSMPILLLLTLSVLSVGDAVGMDGINTKWGKMTVAIGPMGHIAYPHEFEGNSYPSIGPGPRIHGLFPLEHSMFLAVKGNYLVGAVLCRDSWSGNVTFEYDGVIPYKNIENYNFANLGVDYAESINKGSCMLVQVDPTWVQPRLEIKTTSHSWAAPKYDDFVIAEITIINREDEPLYNLHYIYYSGAWNSSAREVLDKLQYDQEYIWDDKRNIHIFYDATSWDPETETPIPYLLSPADVTGDVGNPGNIWEANSIDTKLYTPMVGAIGLVDVSENDLGNSKVEWQIIGAVGADEFDYDIFNLSSYWSSTVVNLPDPQNRQTPLPQFLITPSPKLSWREAHEDPNITDDGTVRDERHGTAFVAVIGPYTLQPGDSIKFKKIYCGGTMDMNLAMKGGLEATKQLSLDYVTTKEGGDGNKPEHAAIKDLRKNYDAALALIETYNQTGFFRVDSVPPPTCGLPPHTAFDDDLKLQAEPVVVQTAGAVRKSAIQLTWMAVADDYVDPITGVADFVGYKIYRSNINQFGPWELIDTVSKESVTVSGDKATYAVEAPIGAPFYYAVTSYDNTGLESGMTAITETPVSNLRAPVSDLSKIRVVPNPFKQESGLPDPSQRKLLKFVNVPARCTIRIYNVAAELIQTIEHNSGWGETEWGSDVPGRSDYMLTRFAENVMPGLYFYHVTDVNGNEHVGKFVIIK